MIESVESKVGPKLKSVVEEEVTMDVEDGINEEDVVVELG